MGAFNLSFTIYNTKKYVASNSSSKALENYLSNTNSLSLMHSSLPSSFLPPSPSLPLISSFLFAWLVSEPVSLIFAYFEIIEAWEKEKSELKTLTEWNQNQNQQVFFFFFQIFIYILASSMQLEQHFKFGDA